MVCGPVPCDEPEPVETLMPVARSNSGNSCSYGPENPPDINTLSCADTSSGQSNNVATKTTTLTALRGFINPTCDLLRGGSGLQIPYVRPDVACNRPASGLRPPRVRVDALVGPLHRRCVLEFDRILAVLSAVASAIIDDDRHEDLGGRRQRPVAARAHAKYQ